MKAPKLPGNLRFIKTRTPKAFSYTPVYYDEKKERLKERRKIISETIQKEAALTDEQREKLREISSSNWRRPYYKRQSYLATVRFFLILMALVLMFVWLFLRWAF